MFITTRSIAGDTLTACCDCAHAISMNKICQAPLQSATDLLKHMAAHKRSRALAPAATATLELDAVRTLGGK
jgi:hypothetical protein